MVYGVECERCHGPAAEHVKFHTDNPTVKEAKYMAVSKVTKAPDYTHIDVHGNQKALLASSNCFINSKMDCSTCHDTHVNERADLLGYTARCMTCHNTDTHNVCKLSNQLTSDVLKNNCIACHMPAQLSKVIIVAQTGAVVHTHHIAVYPGETQKILAYLSSRKIRINISLSLSVLSHNRTYGSVSGGSISYCFLVVQKLFKQTDEFQFLKVTFGKCVVHVTCS